MSKLAVAVFAVCLVSAAAYAQSTGSYTAEVSFAGAGTFGLSLYQASDDSLPVSSTTLASTGTINWADTGAVPGGEPLKYTNSRTFALLSHDLVNSQAVFIYTDNVNGSKYQFTAASVASSPTLVSSFVETLSVGQPVALNPARNIDLACLIISTDQYTDKNFSKSGASGGPAGISDLKIGVSPVPPDYYAEWGTFFATDKSKAGKENGGRGWPIANVYGYFNGSYNAVTGYSYKPGVNYYMFFSADFSKARKGFYYGTDTLTIELDGSFSY
jgi:hypothetical protein